MEAKLTFPANASRHRLLRRAVAAAIILALCPLAVVPVRAQQQEAQDDAPGLADAEQVNFVGELEPYGTWEQTSEFGAVWTPAATDDPDWAPYTQGRWLYSDTGWTFVSDEVISPYGWIVYHYGRWIRHPQNQRWCWIPGTQWAPAWVSWRRGNGFIGWQPLPPESLIGIYESEPTTWVFVATNDLMQADVYRYRLRHERRALLRDSFFEARTERRGFNPGVAPDIVSGATGLPVPSFHLRPQLYPGTIGFIDGRRHHEPPAHGLVGPRKDLVQSPGKDSMGPSDGRPNRPVIVPPFQGAQPGGIVPRQPRQDEPPPPPAERPVPQPPSEGARPPAGVPQPRPNIQSLPVLPREQPMIEQRRLEQQRIVPQVAPPQAPAQQRATPTVPVPHGTIPPLPQQRLPNPQGSVDHR